MDPREQRTRDAVIAAAGELIREGGPGAITHSAVAERSGVGRTTLYRHWPDHASLMSDIMAILIAEWESTLSGDVRPDLIAAIASLAEMLTHQQTRIMVLALMEQAQHDEEASTTLTTLEAASPVRLILERGTDTGALASDLDLDRIVSRLVGPVLHASLTTRRKVSMSEIEELVDSTLDTCRSHDPSQK